MAITRAKQSSLRTGVTKYDNLRAGLPFTPTIGTATDGGTGSTVSVAFTANNTAGLTYTALSSPGSLTGTSTTSPITVSGLTSGTAYTFQVNAANSAGTSPYSAASNSVTPATPSSYESIASAAGTGSSGTITFSSIPGTYKSLQLRMNGITSTGGVSVFLRYNSDTGANYVHHWLYGNGTTATASAQTAKNENRIIGTDNGTSTTSPSAGIIDIHDYASTTKYKTIRAFTGVDKNGTGEINLMSGLWLSTSAITSITVFLASVNWTTDSTFSLYGIN
jgi:hypothetical protein